MFGGSSISDGSKKTYMSKLKKLNQNKIPTDLMFLKDTAGILSQFEAISNPNTRRSSIIAVVSVLKDNKKFKKIYSLYHQAMMSMTTVLNKQSFKSDKTKEKQANVKYDEVLARQKDLATVLPQIQKKTKDF